MRRVYEGFMGRSQENLVRTQRNWRVSVTSHLGPRNAWPWNPAGLARQRDGYTLVGYVVGRTGVDLRGHCGRSRSWNTAVSLAIGISAGLKQPARLALEAFLHYKLMMNCNLACLSLGASWQTGPDIKACSKWSPVMTAGWSSHQQIIVFCAESLRLAKDRSKLCNVVQKCHFKIGVCHAFLFSIFCGELEAVDNRLTEWLVCSSWWFAQLEENYYVIVDY